MAKGLRASTGKSNRAKLRSRVFGPIEEARKERLSAKLLELASQSTGASHEANRMMTEETDPTNTTVNSSKQDALPSDKVRDDEQDMSVDEAKTLNVTSTPRNRGRIQKPGRGKARAAMVFPVYKKGKRTGPKLSPRQRKKSLKP